MLFPKSPFCVHLGQTFLLSLGNLLHCERQLLLLT